MTQSLLYLFAIPQELEAGPMRFLCIFAIPRTGSSHLDKLLRSCPEFNGKSELFHRHHVGQFRKREMKELEILSGGEVTDAETFKSWRRQNPLETLEALYESGGRRIVVFKVFPNHLPRQILQAAFFPRNDMAFAVLKRRPIESFISSLKAKSSSTYTLVETTALKPSLSLGGFQAWARRTRSWYKFTRLALEARDMPYAQISYGKHLDGKSGEESLAEILPLLEPAGISGIPIPAEIIEGERQDKEARYQDRVDNWDEFIAEAESDPAHARLLKWALRDP